MERNGVIVDSLFYSGGTITGKDIIKTSGKVKYDIAINDRHLFIFDKVNGKLIKAVKVEFQHEYSFKIMKSMVKIEKKYFIELMTDEFWNNVARDAMNNIVKITKGV